MELYGVLEGVTRSNRSGFKVDLRAYVVRLIGQFYQMFFEAHVTNTKL